MRTSFGTSTSSVTSRATTSSVSPTSDSMWSRIGRGVGDVVEVAATGLGHALEEHLVEVIADSERRRGDAARPELGGMAGQLVTVGDAAVGEPVGEEQAAVHAVVEERRRRPARSR